ncbi:hypothetical protein HMI54_001658 [Coelomomyces lativittatus]|nr:hypothetical protein HMI54_001658 [Coelomomyces lativittatus]
MTDSFTSAVPTTYPIPVQCMTWHPQNSHLVALANASGTYQYDLRTSSLTSLTCATGMMALDYHPTHPYTLAMGSRDGGVHVVDVRFPTHAHKVPIHTHAVCQVHYNRYHDPLLLTSSSDTLVQVVKFTDMVEASKTYSFDLHEDSVYSCAWSAADAWVFCSASYDGRVLVHTLPNEWKYQIIMED